MRSLYTMAALVVGAILHPADAMAQTTVECRSRDYQYTECSARDLSRPQLIHQISSSSCILNRTWGYNPRSGYIWVGDGCAGTFADVGGYHHGRGDTYDEDARHYDSRGNDAGAVIGGLVLGAILGAAASSSSSPPRENSNSGYDGCHGTGCLVDDPDDDGPSEPGQLDMR
ncbi:MAG: DUF3011 domain-containing protein [Comamonadaceae bacterium]|nr:DUF3011 domain-containing protein [Comamonadaceae bacterium]